MTTEALYPFQTDAIDRAAKGFPVYLGFDPGLGKSRAALELAMAMKAKRMLIICPASGRYVWERETRKWINTSVRMISSTGATDLVKLGGDGIFVITYGLLSQKDGPIPDVIAKGKPFDLTVIDEAHAVKNSGANRTKAILGKMKPKLGYILPLSGTPAPNHAGELYPILKALYPAALMVGGKALQQWEFEDLFCIVTRKRFGTGRDVRVIEGSRNLPELKKRIAPFMLRVKKEDVLKDLPPVRYDVVPVYVPPTAVPSLPAGLSDEALLKYLSGTGAAHDEHVMRIRRILGVAKVQPAVEYIDNFMEGLPTSKKLLVFAHHKEVIHSLLTGLQDWSPVHITGASSPMERTHAVDRFLGVSKPTSRLMVGNIQAMGTGLTLVGPHCDCSDVIFVEASYSIGENVQAAARIHRIGQKNAVVARFLTAHGTIDDRIQDILARKARDFSALFN